MELFGLAGQEFYGNADESGDAIKPRGDKQIWGTDEDSHLTIATDSVRQTLAEKRKKSAELRVERQAEQARLESDPASEAPSRFKPLCTSTPGNRHGRK